ncbi:NAD(P)/FAD-dependent oxidoreductase [Qipengyuania gelatinilytica]|uniref:NAD(P)/FAD-dependent oxidoreductase n=1 Tax=Qipengyuania gelatinilytica TaxID=2867231 RepID=A0ABX9A428_9SPHN|nr:FAD/NAD(P)-binding oxidoreductase [Qipengyuania gelatinilytica]QZD96026.1 NAD(P)/FAD-dependent oxidoreductase [Qipengyuania gelatinilytica]
MTNGTSEFEVVIVGGGAAGIATAASLHKREPSLRIAIIEPSDKHYYQPGWTMVGGGVFEATQTERDMASVMPDYVSWIRQAATAFEPDNNTVVLADGSRIKYIFLVVAAGLKLDWDGVEGLSDTLGRNGVTSNYRYDLAPYTWELVQGLRSGRALFTQPPMPIKCAGAPQKAMYLSCSEWDRRGVLSDIDVHFHNAGGVLFGVADYVPALMEYVGRYGISLDLNERLTAVDGSAKTANFETADGSKTVDFDMLHVCPPQTAPDFIKSSPLAGEGGWIDVDQHTLRHKQFDNVFGLGDCTNTPNAKTAAAVRKQAPIVATNLIAAILDKPMPSEYDGYGSCPLTVERGKIVLAEFGYGGKLLPSFPDWALDGTKPTRRAWVLKADILPKLYWEGMLKGREWLVKPGKLE